MTLAAATQILIHRVPHNKDNPFLCVSQETVQDHRLSLSARGLLMYLLSLKDDWRIDPQHLARTLELNVETVRKLLKELVMYGYVKPREKCSGTLGQILWTEYQVYERPHTDTPVTDVALAHMVYKRKRVSSVASTRDENPMHGFSMHGEAEDSVIKDSNKKEKESPAEKLMAEKISLAPVGDSHAGVASRIENKQLHPEPEEIALVKAQDPLRSATLHDREKLLPVSQAATPRAAKSGINVPRSIPQATAHSHNPEPLDPVSSSPHANPMQQVIIYAFKIGHGGYAGKIGQFFACKLPHRRQDLWSMHQPETPVSPQEIMALLAWYRQHPAYASSCAERGGKLPSTPAILRDRLDEFRDSEGYAQAMQMAQPLLDRLLRGDSMAVTSSVVKPAAKQVAVESVEAYKTYDPSKDPAYHRAVDPDALETLERLFGG